MSLALVTAASSLMPLNHVSAGVLEVAGGIEMGRFIDGVNLTSNALSLDLAAEWSADNGMFASLGCFTSDNDGQAALQRGCDAALGWFTPLNDKHALTVSVSRHDYSSPVLRDWEYTDASVSWHIGNDYRLELQASDSLLGRGFSGVTASFNFSRAINRNWRINALAGVTSLQSTAPVDTLEYGIVGLEYAQGRWVTGASLMLSSSDYLDFSTLDLDQPELAVSLKYRFY